MLEVLGGRCVSPQIIGSRMYQKDTTPDSETINIQNGRVLRNYGRSKCAAKRSSRFDAGRPVPASAI